MGEGLEARSLALEQVDDLAFGGLDYPLGLFVDGLLRRGRHW
jgi:hypothetical protein